MKKHSLYVVFFFASYSIVIAQENRLRINENIVMLKDSIENRALLFSVNAFLSSAQANSENQWILESERVETQILIDEIQAIQKSKYFDEKDFFKPYVTNITPLEKDKYGIKIAYIGINEGSAVLRASFELLAHKANDGFLISSPLLRNTQNWKSTNIENHIFHYPYSLDSAKVRDYAELASFFDEKLKNKGVKSHYYLCNDEIDPLKLFGVEYKSDYNGNESNGMWQSSMDEKKLFVLNASRLYSFDPHDLWHNRLSQVMSRRKVNRNVDCNIAYLYGGSWGISWEELFTLFQEKFVSGEKVDWLEHRKNRSSFVAGGHKNYTDDFVGALIVKKIESEKDFDAVMELLKAKGEYFVSLEKIAGITQKNYNKIASKLIKEEVNRLGLNRRSKSNILIPQSADKI